jgi:acyl-CoA thioesterase-2
VTEDAMGDLTDDTRVIESDGRYTASISPSWQAWGPNGGYLSAIALRAAAATSTLLRPASYSCHYLNVASFDDVELTVGVLRSSRRAESLRVAMWQGDRPILEALVWVAVEGEGLQHDDAAMPEVPPPSQATLWTSPDRAPIPMWRNLEGRMVGWPETQRWEERSAGSPRRFDWFRFMPRATFDDPFLDAARSLILIDTMMFPAAALAYEEPMRYIAPSLDLSVQFHRLVPDEEWLLCESLSPLAEDGLVGGSARIWTQDGRLVASGAQQMISKPLEMPA